jgi:predicted Na+-dependent transporter
VPLAVVHYGMRRLAVPLFLGKFFHNVLLALLFYGFASWSSDHVSEKASTELAVLVAVLFMVLVGYHAEKARASIRASGSAPAVGAESSRQPDPPGPSRCDHGSNCS